MEQLYNEVDGKVQQGVFTLFRTVFGEELTSTPTTKGLPFVDSPTPAVLSVSVYVLIVVGGLLWIYGRDLKPRAKEPAALQVLVLVHNFFCFALSLYMCVGITYQGITHRYSVWNTGYNPKHKEMAMLLYMFYMSKYLDFMDTIIMVLKRSTRQISLLHVYHHSSIALIWWAIMHDSPGGQPCFSAALNSGVHVFMYAYYFLAGLLGSNSKLRAKYLFWGRYLTQFQIFQFMLNLTHAYYHIKTKSPCAPVWLTKVMFYYMISLLFLFGDFYIHRYIKPSQKEAKTE